MSISVRLSFFSSRDHTFVPPTCDVEVPAGDVGRCLGNWWKGDLLATKSVDENILKARGAFFHYGSIGTFQAFPLSSKSVLDCCVMPK